MQIAKRNQIQLGKATIYCNLDDSSKNEYEIEIEKIFINNNEDNKSMLIKVKDKDLLEKTGRHNPRNERKPSNPKRKTNRLNNKRPSKRPNPRLCCVWGYNGKRNARKLKKLLTKNTHFYKI